MFDDPFLAVAGIFFYLAGLNWIDEARHGRRDWGFKPIILPLALWFLYENSFLLFSSDIYDQLIGYAAVFCLASPLLGYILFGRQGRVRKTLFKMIGFAALGTALTFIFAAVVFEDQLTAPAPIAGFATAALAFLPYKRMFEALQRRRRNKQAKHQQLQYERARRAREAAQAANQAREEEFMRSLVEKLRQ